MKRIRMMCARIAFAAAASAAAGCLSSAPEAPSLWTIEYRRGGGPVVAPPVQGVPGARPEPAVRVARVDVRAPFDGERIAVERKDGTIVFDPRNSFAAPPASLLRWAALDAVSGSPLADAALDRMSSASTPLSLELTVRRLVLDCTRPDSRIAKVEAAAVLLDGRKAVCASSGAGEADAGAGDYTAAFSTAFARAMDSLTGKLKIPEK